MCVARCVCVCACVCICGSQLYLDGATLSGFDSSALRFAGAVVAPRTPFASWQTAQFADGAHHVAVRADLADLEGHAARVVFRRQRVVAQKGTEGSTPTPLEGAAPFERAACRAAKGWIPTQCDELASDLQGAEKERERRVMCATQRHDLGARRPTM